MLGEKLLLATVTRIGALNMQICIPKSWTDEEAKAYADKANPSGTQNGWNMRKSKEYLDGDPERNPCSEREGFVHITFDA